VRDLQQAVNVRPVTGTQPLRLTVDARDPAPAADLAVGDHSGTSPSLQLPNGGTYYLLARLTAGSSWMECDAGNDSKDVAVAPQTGQVSGPVIVENGTAGYSETGA